MGTDRNPCPGLWKTPVIRHDGRLMACCADVDGEIPVGNLSDHTFQEMWEGALMTRYRLWHIEGRFDQMPKCEGCGGIGWIDMSPEEIRAWLIEVGREELYEPYLRRIGRLSEG